MQILMRSTGKGLHSVHDSVVVPIQPAGTRNAVFLVPGGHTDPDLALADAQFFWYIQLIRALGGDRPVHGLRTFGLRRTLRPYRSIEHMAAGYADAVLSSQPHGPHLLVGDCVGGILAFEIARQLSFRSSRVALVLLDTHYPDREYKQYLLENFPDIKKSARRRPCSG